TVPEGDSDSSGGSNGTCAFLCRAETWCTNNDAITHASMICDEEEMICCELPDAELDSDSSGDDSDTGHDSEGIEYTCEYECHSASWCTTTEAVIYYEQTCAGNQICCDAQ
ncbi:MAG: hypothetical protein JXX29_01770, partial [Deltaproteobacteria bacterium]|nr:hypothetical protein [Deltaproteobacteria bacterium]MBN2670368.1 hypothetical protein [Deltaproteobacteria bacterium]